MSYRTKVNGKQIFGNNECYPEWLEFIKANGIEVSEECHYKGEITDFMGALEVIEKITLRIVKERDERNQFLKDSGYKETFEELYGLFDFSYVVEELDNQDADDKYANSLFDKLNEIVENGYVFMPYQFYKACEDKLERDNVFAVAGHFECFKLKDGESLKVEAN